MESCSMGLHLTLVDETCNPSFTCMLEATVRVEFKCCNQAIHHLLCVRHGDSKETAGDG